LTPRRDNFTDQESLKEQIREVNEYIGLDLKPRGSLGISEYNLRNEGEGYFGLNLERDRRFSPGLSSIGPAGYPGHRKNEQSAPAHKFFAAS